MPTYVLTIQGMERDEVGVRLKPGLPMHAFEERPALKTIMQGSVCELRRPDGVVKLTRLVTYGIEVQAHAGNLYVTGPPDKQPLVLTLSSDVLDTDLPPGTELWFMDAGTIS